MTDIPGTTRDTIEESIKIGGVPLILMDTAGIRETENKIERIGIERARQSSTALARSRKRTVRCSLLFAEERRLSS